LPLSKEKVDVVVSEERGRISIVEGGRITKDLDGDKLREQLHRHFNKSKEKGPVLANA